MTVSGPSESSTHFRCIAPPLDNSAPHVWVLDLHALAPMLPRLRAVLSEVELRRADRFVHEPSRVEFTVARGVLRMILSQYLDTSPSSLMIESDEFGKPALAAPYAWLNFNVSHSGDVALIAASSTGPIGVDVERAEPDRELMKMADRFFSLAERRALSALPEAQLTAGFYRCWTSKEAYIKGLGIGLHYALDQFVTDVGPNSAALIGDHSAPEHEGIWKFHPIHVPEGYVATLAGPFQASDGPVYGNFEWV